MKEVIRSFDELASEQQSLGGGKGGTLARLRQAGYPVPDGFVILPAAFAGDELSTEAWAQVQARLARMRKRDRGMAFAVRSSAMSEDAAQASFAGEFETVLDVHTDEMVRQAIHTVRGSRHAERVRAYSEAKGMDTAHDMAVVVQQLVRADISGVLFTADPVTGNLSQMAGDFVFGLGEALVSGEAEPYTFTLERPAGRYDGPPDVRGFARRLYKLGCHLEKELGGPQDIEWAIADGKLYLLQSRPITTLSERDPFTGEWNATFVHDYLWTNMIVGEVFPTTTTPSTWSVWGDFFSSLSFGDVSPIGNIAGHPYLNYSLTYSFLLKLLRKHERVMGVIGDSIGAPPPGVDIPSFPVPWKVVLFQLVPQEFSKELKKAKLAKNAPEYLAIVRDRCQALRQRVVEAQGDELISLWSDEIRPLWNEIHLLQDKTNEELQGLTRKLKTALTKLLGGDEANALLTTISGAGELASLGPLIGLSRLRSGDLTRGEYLERYGHRGPHENELAEPRPHEDPSRLDTQLAEFDRSPVDVTALLKRRDAEFDAVRQEIARQLPPRKAQRVARQIAAIVEANGLREATRSELTRIVDVIRALYLRGGEFSGLGDGVFFLTAGELVAVLRGDTSPALQIPARRQGYEAYRALPPLPAWIRGRFDPFQWAADPDRRRDVFGASAGASLPAPSADNVIAGHPGSAGRVEGLVQRIDSPDEGHRLQPGEVLVASTTNVGWTPLFPRAAAVVTDIGGSLSHAAIVARELGIPAVVGCGDATIRLKTGDRVLVDGRQGTIEILDRAE
jgi:phosphohistidine swiveling domain-containing protein